MHIGSRLLAVYDRTKRLESLTIEFHHLKLIDRRIVSGTGLDPDAREIDVDLQVQTAHLFHDVVARKIVSALSEHLNECFCGSVAEHGGAVLLVAVRIVF